MTKCEICGGHEKGRRYINGKRVCSYCLHKERKKIKEEEKGK